MLQTKAGRRILHGVVLGVLLLNLAIGAKVYSESDANSTVNDPHANLDLFVNVLERVRRDYVDGGELTYEDLVHGAAVSACTSTFRIATSQCWRRWRTRRPMRRASCRATAL